MTEGGVRVPSGQPKVSALSDERVDFVKEQVFTALRLKTDKWNRFIGAEENQKALFDFLDHGLNERLVLFTGPGGALHIGDEQVRAIHSHICIVQTVLYVHSTPRHVIPYVVGTCSE